MITVFSYILFVFSFTRLGSDFLYLMTGKPVPVSMGILQAAH